MVSESSDMKYFGGVQSLTGQAANYTTDVAGKLYTSAKQFVPERAQPTFKNIEDKVSEYGSPVLTTLQDKGGKILQVADAKVRLARCFRCSVLMVLRTSMASKGAADVSDGSFVQVDDAANSAYSLHDKHYPQFQQAKDQYLKVVESKVADLRENGISGKVGQAADAVSTRTNSAVAEAKKLPGIVNKQTEVALDRVEDVINQVASYPVGQFEFRDKYWQT